MTNQNNGNNIIMEKMKWNKSSHHFIILFQIFAFILSHSSIAQTKQSFRNHEEIDIGGGMKIEILRCVGEGPLEECDCIYFTDKRQNGTRVKQHANRIKEEERAALLAKGIKATPRTNEVNEDENRSDKAIPTSVFTKPKPSPTRPTLEDAVKKADSVAKASSLKIREDLKSAVSNDSSQMDRVYIPRVNESGEAFLEPSRPVKTTESASDIKPTTKDTVSVAANIPVPVTLPFNIPASVDTVQRNIDAVKSSARVDLPLDPKTPVVIDTLLKTEEIVKAAAPAQQTDTVTVEIVENNWVKQYQLVKTNDSVVVTEGKLQAGEKQIVPVDSLSVSDRSVQTKTDKNKVDTVTRREAEGIATHNDPVVPSVEIEDKLPSVKPETGSLDKVPLNRNLIGKSAEVNTKGEWEKAIIIDKETEFLYKVHYPGRTADNDEWVSVTQIRDIDSIASITTNDIRNTRGVKANSNCSFEAPAPPVFNGDRFSEKLAKRKIYELYAGNTRSKKIGVTFLSLHTASPYVNTVSISSNSTIEVKFPFAPAGAMIYPVTAEYKVCEQVSGKTSSQTMAANYGCFRNKSGTWTCSKIE